jgi:hypothetical protein
MLQIYVLQLENDKWFLHISNVSDSTQIIFECQTLYDFVKKNAPIKIYETLKIFDHFDINTWTKRYMVYFGIDNVRGGIYSDEILPEYLRKGIEFELAASLQDYEKKLNIFNAIRSKNTLTLSDFQREKDAYNKLLDMGYNMITRDFFEDLDWMKNVIINSKCKTSYKSGLCTKTVEDISKYNAFIKKIDLLNKYYYQLNEEKIKVLSSVLLKNPNFVLDNCFYHSNSIQNLDDEINNATEFLDKYEFMGYTLINVIDEMEYDFLNH